jgi:hypothetical protein
MPPRLIDSPVPMSQSTGEENTGSLDYSRASPINPITGVQFNNG